MMMLHRFRNASCRALRSGRRAPASPFSAVAAPLHQQQEPEQRAHRRLDPEELKEKMRSGWGTVAKAYTEGHHVHAAGSGHRRTFHLMQQLVVNVVAKRCEQPPDGRGEACHARATHGQPGHSASRCAAHSKPGMVDFKSSRHLPPAVAAAPPAAAALAAAAADLMILDVASAGGEPALTLARGLPAATVVGTDLAPEMVALLQQRVEQSGLKNVMAAVADGEQLKGFEDGSFDAVTCAFGLMFMPRYQTALKEFHRVLKPDGLAVASVWADNVPRFLLIEELLECLDPGAKPIVDPTALGGRDGLELKEAFEAAGFQDVIHSTYEVQAAGNSEEDAFEFLVGSTPFMATISALAARGRKNVHEEAREIFLDIFRKGSHVTRREDGSWIAEGNMAHLYCGRKPTAWKSGPTMA